jgi:hypothetical protein
MMTYLAVLVSIRDTIFRFDLKLLVYALEFFEVWFVVFCAFFIYALTTPHSRPQDLDKCNTLTGEYYKY